MDHFISQYFGMNVAHLLDDELTHELVIRGLDADSESRSVQERKCRAGLKDEASDENPTKEYVQGWESIIDELELCDKSVQEIKHQLEIRAYKKAPDQKHKSRLLHYLFRVLRAKVHTKKVPELNTISEIAGQCVRLLNTFFSIASPYPEVRSAEINIANDSLLRMRYAFPEDDGGQGSTAQNQNPGDQYGSSEQREVLLTVPEGSEESSDEEEEEGAVGGQISVDDKVTEEVEGLKSQNANLKSMVDRLLGKMRSMELEIEQFKAQHQSRNSTRGNLRDELLEEGDPIEVEIEGFVQRLSGLVAKRPEPLWEGVWCTRENE